MRIISWNVNGIRAVAKKNFFEALGEMNPDILCLQETKAQDDQVEETLAEETKGYHLLSTSAVRKGYSGTAILTKDKPLSVSYGIKVEEHDQEGRVITAEYEHFYLVNVYVPNSGNGLARLDYREEWDKAFLAYLMELDAEKPVILCGDLNVAHTEIDLARPKPNYNKSAGFTQREIDGITAYIDNGLKDTFRTLHPEEIKYSWWSYRGGARAKNVGWRIDYFLASEKILDKVNEAFILNDVLGSDHCPVGIELEV